MFVAFGVCKVVCFINYILKKDSTILFVDANINQFIL
jgi:hypothetical protein